MTCMNTWAGVRAPTKLSRVAPQRVRGGGGGAAIVLDLLFVSQTVSHCD